MAGPESYTKVVFTLDGTAPVPATSVEGGRWVAAEGDPRLLPTVGTCLADSLDAWDRAAVADLGADGAARLITSPWDGFRHDPSWWELLVLGDEVVGFVLPVVYEGTGRNGLDEGTIMHLGVVPQHRGRGLGRAVLRRATATLLDHGVWRLYVDTAAANASMQGHFEAEGWQRGGEVERPVHLGRT